MEPGNTDDSNFFPGETINVYPTNNSIGFVFQDENWAQRFYLEAILKNRKGFRLEGREVIWQSHKSD